VDNWRFVKRDRSTFVAFSAVNKQWIPCHSPRGFFVLLQTRLGHLAFMSLHTYGVKTILVLNGHGGNVAPLRAVHGAIASGKRAAAQIVDAR
jgi:hypothetical protein